MIHISKSTKLRCLNIRCELHYCLFYICLFLYNYFLIVLLGLKKGKRPTQLVKVFMNRINLSQITDLGTL